MIKMMNEKSGMVEPGHVKYRLYDGGMQDDYLTLLKNNLW